MTYEIETVFGLDDDSLFAEMILSDIGLFLWDIITDINDPEYAQYQDNLASYTVPGAATAFAEIQFDLSVDPVPTWEDVKARFFLWIWIQHEIEFLSTDINLMIAETLGNQVEYTKTNNRWEGVQIRSGETKPTWKTIHDAWMIKQAADSIKDTVAAAYKIMSVNIATQVFATFLTTDEASANAFSQSWRIKAERPEEYIAEGILAREAIAGFSIGDPLDDAIKIGAYFAEKVNHLITFDKFRDAEILIYLTAKAIAEA